MMIPTKPHRAKALEAVLGSRGVRESINGYKDNDVLYRLKDTKHTHFGTYKPAMGSTIVPVARRAPHPYKYKND